MKHLKAAKPPKQSEAQIERAVVDLLTHAGCIVYRVSGAFGNQRGGTRLSPGLADLTVFLPTNCLAPGTFVIAPYLDHVLGGVGFFETKTPAGLAEHHRLAPLPAPPTPSQTKAWTKVRKQAEFKARCEARGIPYAMGGVEEAWQFLMNVGLASRATGAWLLTRRTS